jgi:hypothetical protein
MNFMKCGMSDMSYIACGERIGASNCAAILMMEIGIADGLSF